MQQREREEKKRANFTPGERFNQFLPLFSPSILAFREEIVSFILPLLFASNLVGFGPIGEGGGERKRFDLFSRRVKLFRASLPPIWNVFAQNVETP